MVNLKGTKSVCCHFSKACSSTHTPTDPCLGYLENNEIPHSFKLIFYDAGRNTIARSSHQDIGREAVPVSKLLRSFQTLHKLTLAYKLAATALQYHSTAWLPRDWSLQDVAYFAETSMGTTDEISNQLESLHLSTRFPGKCNPATTHAVKDLSDLTYIYGIKNLTLAKLGVVMIEICVENDISSFSLDPTLHDVISARKVLMERPPVLDTLGPKYIEIARKCIDCNFSCGDNLNDDDLHSAVYIEVVCALEDIIKHWKGFYGVI